MIVYSSGRFTSKERPKIPERRTSGCCGGAGVASACGGGAGAAGTGKLSHFIEYTNWPSAVRPIGAQLSTRAAVLLGASFVCAHAGDETKRIARIILFIGLSRAMIPRATRCSAPLNRIRAEKSNEVVATERG
jgi:hypothetical protein